MKKRTTLIVALILCTILLGNLAVVFIFGNGGTQVSFTGEAAAYCAELEAQGFPLDYAVCLTKLHLLHPEWSFSPLQITDTNELYTWDYVIERETDSPETNLAPPGDAYLAYRNLLNFNTYDSGYYQASKNAVEYFMDPRNFLNECDLFQFYDLSSSLTATQDAVDAVLEGTFMETAVLENGKGYGEYLLEVGEEVGIDPVYLAAKLRQEQGVEGTSPIISGKCGSLLLQFYTQQTQSTSSGRPVKPPKGGLDQNDLRALDGYYNPFNISASGDGVFAIYQNAMNRAVKGTPEMASQWGGSPSWDTTWKGIYGGAVFIKNNYIDCYQSTIYLQKFNVDGRAGDKNFWSQYMQNVGGALSEGRSLFHSFAANNALDAPCHFLIPVYDEMPSSVCKDPADGACSSFACATDRFSTLAVLDHPLRMRSENEAIYEKLTVVSGSELLLLGEFSHSYGTTSLQYAWDFGDWVTCSDNKSLKLSFSQNLPSYGEHTLVVRGEAAFDSENSGKRSSGYYLCAVLTVTVQPPPSVELRVEDRGELSESLHYEGDRLTLPTVSDSDFAGWVGSDGSFLPSGAEFVLQGDTTYKALYVTYQSLEGAALSTDPNDLHLRFCAVMRQEDALELDRVCDVSPTYFCEVYCNNLLCQSGEQSDSVQLVDTDGVEWKRLSICTPTLEKTQLDDRFSVEFKLLLTYSDGSTHALRAQRSTATRSAAQVALAALADSTAAYSDETVALLRQVAS